MDKEKRQQNHEEDELGLTFTPKMEAVSNAILEVLLIRSVIREPPTCARFPTHCGHDSEQNGPKLLLLENTDLQTEPVGPSDYDLELAKFLRDQGRRERCFVTSDGIQILSDISILDK